jgi:hypothetical protein
MSTWKNKGKVMKYLIFVLTLCTFGCRVTQESKWESSVQSNTRIWTDRPQAVEYIDLTATLKRNW